MTLGPIREGVVAAGGIAITCASCARDLGPGDPRVRRPLGRGDALVSICAECDAGDLRAGGYSFGGGRGELVGSLGGFLVRGTWARGHSMTPGSRR